MNILGIDVGGVIISREGSGGDTNFFSDNYLRTPPTKNVFEVIARVRNQFERVFIISKCGAKVQAKTLSLMKHHNFHTNTGIREDEVFFCKRRHEKVGVVEKLGVTHYIDDRDDILESMKGVVPNLYIFGEERYGLMHRVFTPIRSWDEFERKLKAELTNQ